MSDERRQEDRAATQSFFLLLFPHNLSENDGGIKGEGRMSKNITKKCHWVPQAYLRNFACPPESEEKIWRLSKETLVAERKPIAKVAVKFHLYSPQDTAGRRDDRFERKLGDLETWFGSPAWKALCGDFPDYSKSWFRKMISLLVATMHLRNPSVLEWTKGFHQSVLASAKGNSRPPSHIRIGQTSSEISEDTWAEYLGANDEDLKRAWISIVEKCGWFAEQLMSLRWAILISERPVFVTSDNPVAFYHPSLQFKGMNDPQTFLMFPLSPTRVLTMDHRHDQPDGRYYPLNHSGASTNTLIWRNSIEHMFSSRHPDTVCEEMVADAEAMGFASH